MEEEIVRIYVAELLLALQHMRSRCCVHRDIKATNCLLTESGHIKLCDFSASKAFSDEVDKDVHRTYTVIGTVEFMSPELLLRRVGYSYETDLWSLGVHSKLSYYVYIYIYIFRVITVVHMRQVCSCTRCCWGGGPSRRCIRGITGSRCIVRARRAARWVKPSGRSS